MSVELAVVVVALVSDVLAVVEVEDVSDVELLSELAAISDGGGGGGGTDAELKAEESVDSVTVPVEEVSRAENKASAWLDVPPRDVM